MNLPACFASFLLSPPLFPSLTQHADTGVHVTQKSFKTDRRDKPKHSGKVGATTGPKKGGGGGRGTWGRPGDEAEDAGQIDPNDPSGKIDKQRCEA